MAFPLYLAMTAAEIQMHMPPSSPIAYMACHFSSYGTGLSNLPSILPHGSLLILNDRTPIHGHDPGRIAAQLAELAEKHQASGILLDFQRPDCEEIFALARHLSGTLPCPVGISQQYAGNLNCPVFLPPVPPDVPPDAYLLPWQGREIWLEAALDGMKIAVNEQGYSALPLPFPGQSGGFEETRLHCHYRCRISEAEAVFTLYRTREDLNALMDEAESFGVTRAVGLWQELG